MKYKLETIGKGKPKVAIVGCVHGDEVIGKLVIRELKKLKPKQGTLTLITANPVALKKNQRFIENDLNRSFPGKKNGCLEEQIAHDLTKVLRSQDYVLDVHATNSEFKELVILHHLNQKTKKILKSLPIKRVAKVDKKIYKGKSMLHCCDNTVCLEFGPDKSGQNYKRATQQIKCALCCLGMLGGKLKLSPRKELYRVGETYPVPENFEQSRTLKDFQKIKKGRYIGHASGTKMYSEREFYPIFLGRGRYPETLALMAEKEKLEL